MAPDNRDTEADARIVLVMLGEAISRMKGHPERSLLIEAQRRLNRAATIAAPGRATLDRREAAIRAEAVKPWREALARLVDFLDDVYWPEGQSPLMWQQRIDAARSLLDQRPESGPVAPSEDTTG